MKQILLAFFLCLFAPQVFAQSSISQPLRVIVYGDGLTLGEGLRPEQAFGPQLEALLKAGGFEVEVLNMSEAAQTTTTARENLDSVTGKAPDVVILQVGENDLRLGIDAGIIRDNLYKTVYPMLSKGIYVVVIGLKPPANYSEEYAKHIAKTFTNLDDYVPIYPYALQNIAGKTDMTLADGNLPNARGVDVMVRGVYPLVDVGLRWKMQMLAERQKTQPNNAAPAYEMPPPLPE